MTASTGKRRTRGVAVQTMETLLARTVEVGECREWQGYVGNGVPQVSHQGKVVAVRRLMLELQGRTLRPGDHAGCSCGNSLCVQHIVQRTHAQHARAMSKSPARSELARAAKLAQHARAHRAKITMEIAREIRCSPDSGPVLAARYGIDKGLVSRIRRNEAWREFSSPFAGLGSRGAAA